MQKYTYRIHLQPEPEGGYTVTVPALPGCVTWGKDFDHAIAMAQEAIQAMIESLLMDGEPVPREDSEIHEIGVQVTLPIPA